MAPPRKPEVERVRRNVPDPSTFIPTKPRGEVPAAPGLLVHEPHALEWWDRLWREPIAVLWRSFDEPAVARLCLLYAQVFAGLLDDKGVLMEVRSLEDRFGLNPRARQQLRWLVAEESAGPAKPKPARRQRLKVVGE
jgi:hypothetical protein